MSIHRFMVPLCAAATLAAPAALAAPFVAGHLGLTGTKYEDVKAGIGFSLAGGYEVDEFGKFPLFVEGSYYDSGKLKINDGGGLKLSYDGFQLFGGAALKIGSQNNSRIWGKAGYYALDGKLSDGSGGSSEKTSGLSIGLGGDWMFSSQLGARFEIEQPIKVKAVPGLGSDETTSLSIIKIGLVWRPRFGGSPVAAPVPQVGTSITPTLAMPPVAGSVERATPLANGTVATLRAGTGLRAQARSNSRHLLTLTTDASVTLAGSSSNTSGEWWYVKGAGIAGWVLASELVTP